MTCFMPEYIISRVGDNGEAKAIVAEVAQKFTCCNPKFSIKTSSGELSLSGDWMGLNYEFRRGERLVATVSQKVLAMRDKYSVEIAPGEDVFLILACCIVVDKCVSEN